MKKLTQLALVTVGSAAFLALPAKAQIITQWTFENDTVANNNSPAASTGTGTADAIGMGIYPTPNDGTNQDDVLVGATGDTGTNGNADLSNEWRVRAQGTKSNPANGWSSQAPIGTQGAQFFASTAGVNSGAIQISFDFYVTNQAENNMEVLYTTNGGTSWTNLALNIGTNADIQNMTGSASDANTVNGAYVQVSNGQNWFQDLNATITDPNALNDAGFGFEVVNASTGADVLGASGGAYNNSSGNWRFDNVTIDAVATPEPTSWMLGFGACALLAALRFARRGEARS